MADQYEEMLLQLAEARRMHGSQDREGTIWQVWRQNKEQKVRVVIGIRPDGSEMLSPWLKVDSHHGTSRTQKKFHKGQNVKLTSVGADFRQAMVSAHGENKDHPEPDHADDIHETSQHGTVRHRTGPDFHESWLSKPGGGFGGGGGTGNFNSRLGALPGGDLGAAGAIGTFSDPDKDSHALARMGAAPQKQPDKNEPWDGPSPNGGDPKQQHLHWAGTPGNTPMVKGGSIVSQFDKDAKSEVTMGAVLRKVQSSNGLAMSSPDEGDGSATRTSTDKTTDGKHERQVKDNASGKTSSTVHSNGDISHIVQDLAGNISRITQQMKQTITQMKGADGSASTLLMQATKMFMQVTQGGKSSSISITGGAISLNSAAVNVNTDGPSSPASPLTIPSVNANGDAPLIAIPTLWQAAASLAVVTNLPTAHVGTGPLSISATMHAALFPLKWLMLANLSPAAHLSANPVPAKFMQVWGMTVEPRVTADATLKIKGLRASLAPAAHLTALGTLH